MKRILQLQPSPHRNTGWKSNICLVFSCTLSVIVGHVSEAAFRDIIDVEKIDGLAELEAGSWPPEEETCCQTPASFASGIREQRRFFCGSRILGVLQ